MSPRLLFGVRIHVGLNRLQVADRISCIGPRALRPDRHNRPVSQPVQYYPDRRRGTPSPLLRKVASIHGILSFLFMAGLMASIYGWYTAALHRDNRAAANDLASSCWLTTDPSPLEFTHPMPNSKHPLVDGVAVHLPGVAGPVDLRLTRTRELPYWTTARKRYIQPRAGSIYRGPLQVCYRVNPDGTITAAATKDIAYWRTPGPVQRREALGIAGTTLVGLAVTGAVVRERRRRARRSGQP